MDLNLFHLLVEDSYTATVPSDPDLVADQFGRNFVISACDFDIADRTISKASRGL